MVTLGPLNHVRTIQMLVYGVPTACRPKQSFKYVKLGMACCINFKWRHSFQLFSVPPQLLQAESYEAESYGAVSAKLGAEIYHFEPWN